MMTDQGRDYQVCLILIYQDHGLGTIILILLIDVSENHVVQLSRALSLVAIRVYTNDKIQHQKSSMEFLYIL